MRDLSANHEADRAACKRVQAELDDAIMSLAAENAANKLLHKEVHDANAIAKQASRAKQKAERIIEALREGISKGGKALQIVQQEVDSLKILSASQAADLFARDDQLKEINRRLADTNEKHAILQGRHLSLALHNSLLRSRRDHRVASPLLQRNAQLEDECLGLEAMLVDQAVSFEEKLTWARRRKKPKPRVDASTQTEDHAAAKATIIDFLLAQIRHLQANHVSCANAST